MTELTAGDAGRVLDEFRPGRSVYIQGAVGEPLALRGVLASRPEALAGVSLTSGLIPGVNDFDYAALHDQVHLTAFPDRSLSGGGSDLRSGGFSGQPA